MQHYFIGIKLPQELAEQLVELRNVWHLNETHKRLPAAEDLHITLQYLGAVDPEKLRCLHQKLDLLHVPSMKITLKGISTFGNPSTPRVVYAAVKEQPLLYDLQHVILEKCLELNLAVDTKKFVPHVTLAKKWSGQQVGFAKEMMLEEASFYVNQFAVYAIHPGENPSYHAIHSIDLED